MSYLDQSQGSRFKSYLGEDPSYVIDAQPSGLQKATSMPQAVALAERRRKMMTPMQRAQQYNQLVAFIKTLPAGKQKFLKDMATRYANAGAALNGYSGQHKGMGDWASAILGAATLYMSYDQIQDQKDHQKQADKLAAQRAAAEAEYQRAQIRMAEEAATANNAAKLAQAKAAGNKPAMSTGTKVAIGAGVVVAGTAAYMAMN